mmetsp:Transcript_31052/g.77453  ORF Transcript_31052/g.77453 Transcript_31052/m.77453 type:complete len:436 (+) Transcript_31052:1701-3008(+)
MTMRSPGWAARSAAEMVVKLPRMLLLLSTMSDERASVSWKRIDGCKKEKMCMISSSGSGSGRSGQRSSRQSHASNEPCEREGTPGGGRGGTMPSGGATVPSVASRAAVGGAWSGSSTGGCSRGRPRRAPRILPVCLAETKETEERRRGGGALGGSAAEWRRGSMAAGGGAPSASAAAWGRVEAESAVSRASIARLTPREAEPEKPAVERCCSVRGEVGMMAEGISARAAPREKGSVTEKVRGLSGVRASGEVAETAGPISKPACCCCSGVCWWSGSFSKMEEGEERHLCSPSAFSSRRSPSVSDSSRRTDRGSLFSVEGESEIIASASAISEHAVSSWWLFAAATAWCIASETRTRLRSRSSWIGGSAARGDSTAGREMDAHASQLLVSILTASTYESENLTVSIVAVGSWSFGSQTSTGTWQTSPACRSPMATS